MNRPPRCCKCQRNCKRGHWGPRDRWICHECAELKERKTIKYIIAGSGAVKDDDYTVDLSARTNRGGRSCK